MISRRTTLTLLLALGPVAIAGCEPTYVYAPAVSTAATVSGRLATYTPIPPEAPRGDVRIATFGLVGLRTPGQGDDDEVVAVQLRMVVANNSDKPWTVDTREQRVKLPADGESRAAYVSTDQGAPPVVVVPPGGKREIDLFYPLPEHLEKERWLPAFDLVWKVQTDTRLVVERAPFERLKVEPRPDVSYYGGYGWGYGWGPVYYDPWYPRGAFVGARVYSPVYRSAPPPVIRHRGHVRRAPPARR